MNISILGAGNVAWHLSQALEKAGHIIQEIYSRRPENAEKLATQLTSATATNQLDFRRSKAELFILAIKDDALEEVVKQMQLPAGTTVVHTSGSQALSGLEPLREKAEIGIFYPLQTFSKEKKLDFSEIPLCIEASSLETEEKLLALARQLSKHVYQIDSQKRKFIHLAAVFACNFSNYLWQMAQEILAEQDLNLEILAPLLRETVEKALQTNPYQAQTGPARRGDQQVVQAHLDLLEGQAFHQEIYKLMSDHILRIYHPESS